MFDLLQDYGIHEEKGIYHLENEKVEMYGSLAMLDCIRELRTGEYEYDYRNKVVLDVGGFEGESAIYFWLRGAKRVIIYEPVNSHVQFINKNVKLTTLKLKSIRQVSETKTAAR
jgi:predicted RNA methylase